MGWDAPTVVIGVLGLFMAVLGLFMALLALQVNNLKGDMRDSEKRLSDTLRAESASLMRDTEMRLSDTLRAESASLAQVYQPKI